MNTENDKMTSSQKLNPLVSIIIPVYNGSNYLNEAVDSALNQTYKRIEIIIVNDGSKDNNKTEKIAWSYGKKIRYFYKENGGVSTALNFGIKNMKGDYFAWLSHDDVYQPDNINIQIKNIIEKRGVVSCCKTGTIFNDRYILPKETNNIYIYDKPLDHWNQWIYGCSLVIEKNILMEAGAFNEENRTTQDTELIWNLLSKFQIHFIDRPLVLRRVHNEQGFFLDAENNKMDAYKLLKDTLEKDGIDFFLANKVKNTKIKRIFTYIFLAWKYQEDRRKIENPIPKYILNDCVNQWSSSLNPCLYCLHGLVIFKQIVWRYHDTKRVISAMIKAFRFKGVFNLINFSKRKSC